MRIHDNDEFQNLIDEIDEISANIRDEEVYLKHIDSLEKIANQQNDSILKMVVFYHKSNIAYAHGDMATCGELTNQALNLAKEMNQTYYLLRCYNSLAIIDSEYADYYSSISHYLQALHIADIHPEYQHGSILLNNIGNLFVWLNEHEKALDYLLNAYDKYYIEETSDSFILDIIILNIIEEYSVLKQYDKLEKWLQLDIGSENIEIKHSIGIILNVNEIAQLYTNNDTKTIHKKLDNVLNKKLEYDNYIYIFRSYIRLLELAINAKDQQTADLTISCMDSINEDSHIETFRYDYVVLKYKYYETFLEAKDNGINAKEVLKEYFNTSQKVINQLRNTYTRRLVIESELLKVRYEKENAEMYNLQLQKDIELDFFTGILNKVSIERYINSELKSKQNDFNHALLLIDIDHFKSVNDNYGHDRGDEIILSVVDMIKSCCSENILFGRFGGDEFILFIKAVNNKSFVIEFVNEVLEKARHIKIAENSYLTLSVGVYFMQEGDDFNLAFGRADEALYTTKRKCRNNYTVYENND